MNKMFIGLMTIMLPLNAIAISPYLNLSGKIEKADGSPLTLATVNFSVSVIDPAGSCALYTESLSVPMSSGDGFFKLRLGSGTKSFGPDLISVFSNSGTLTCSGSGSYTPTANANRKIRIQFYDGTTWNTITPDVQVDLAPYAGFAKQAEKLGENVASDFLLRTAVPTCGANNFLTFNGTSLQCFEPTGSSGDWSAITGKPTTLSGYGITDALSKTLNSGMIYIGNASNVATAVSVSGDFSLSPAGVATLNPSGVTAGTYNKVTVDAKGRVTAGSNLTAADIPNLDASKITTGLAPSATTDTTNASNITTGTLDAARLPSTVFNANITSPANGQFVRYNGSAWVNSSINAATDLAGTIPVSRGGTGTTSLTTGSLLVGGASSISTLSAATSGNILYASSPTTWSSSTPDLAGLVDKTNNQVIGGVKTFTDNLKIDNDKQLQILASNSNYVALKAPDIVSANYTITLPNSMGTSGQTLVTDSSGRLSWASLGGGGTVSSISTGIGLTGGTITSTGTIAVDVGTTANKIVQLDSSARIPAVNASLVTNINANNIASGTINYSRLPVGNSASTVAAGDDPRFSDSRAPAGIAGGDLSGSFPNPLVSKIQGRAVDNGTPTDGQVLLWDNGNSTWRAQHVRMQDVRTSWGGNQLIPTTSCTTKQAMVWSVITDRMTCQDINLTSFAGSNGILPVANGGTGSTGFATDALLVGGGSGQINTRISQNGDVLVANGSAGWQNSPELNLGAPGNAGKMKIWGAGASAAHIILQDNKLHTEDDHAVNLKAIDLSGDISWSLGILNGNKNLFRIGTHQPSQELDFFSGGTSNSRMRINSSGYVGIGTTSPASKLHVVGETTLQGTTAIGGNLLPTGTFDLGSPAMRFSNIFGDNLGSNSQRFNHVYSQNITSTNAVNTTSDRRLKENIKTTPLGLDFILKLNPVVYTWNDGTDSLVHNGFLAQEVQETVTETTNDSNSAIISYDSNSDRYGLRYTELIAPIVKSIQDLFSLLTTQESELTQLKAENQAMKAYLCKKDPAAPFCP
ncbi:MAG: tail fiber domain-containing protein [Bdellovibrionia bacterium]